jgi:hypothetical protein
MTRMPTVGLPLLDRNLRFAGVTNDVAEVSIHGKPIVGLFR